MRITISLLLLCLFCVLSSRAQNTYSVKGSVADSSSNSKLVNTTISVLNAKDSILRKFTRAAENGSFAINNIGKGKFILMVTYPGYADYIEHFSLDSIKKQHDFGKINLTLKSKLLADVIIKGEIAAIKIKGDTTEFNAAAYKIQPNSKVEDLLKQLPGIQVDKDGKITAQGQTVSKVLVDGEEFFGDDPTLVTKNIRGDMVDKVQLYDKKSDQATFTGIDDGQTTKTINIKLKEDKKNGYFGKLDGNLGTDKFYQAQALYNRFQGKKKFSVFGVAANTGKLGLSWEDNDKLGTSNVQVSDDGGLYISGGGSDLDSYGGQYDGRGIPVARNSGAHYDGKWDSDKKSINANYKIGSLTVTGTTNNQTQSLLLDSVINKNSDQNYRNQIFRQKLDVTYQTSLDTTSNLKLYVDGTSKNTTTTNNYLSTTLGDSILLNDNSRSLTNKVDNQIFNASALYTKKFKKTGRTFSLNVSQNINRSNADGYLNSLTTFYDKTGSVDSTQHTDQRKVNNINSASFNGNITYTEPLSKKLSLIFNYGLAVSNNSADRKSFNQSATGRYDSLDRVFSNNYLLNQLSNQGGAIFNYKTTKATINIGTRATKVDYKQTDKYTNTVYKRDFINWSPQAYYMYRFSQQQYFRISYNGSTSQPGINQIQPIRVNTDPLNITIGNPLLKPSFRNSFSAYYSSYKILTSQSIYFSGSYSFINNQIVNYSKRNALTGVDTSQSINLLNHTPFNYSAYSGISRKILGINTSLYLNFSGSTSFSYTNGLLNTTKSNNYTAEFSFSKSEPKKYDFYLSGGPGYTIGKSSLQPKINNNGYVFNGSGDFNIYLPGKIQVASDARYQYQGKTQSFANAYSQVLLNSSISKTFLKEDNLKISISGNDLLNQNSGFSRNANNGNITQNTYTTIKRFFLFTITWDFNHMGGADQTKK